MLCLLPPPQQPQVLPRRVSSMLSLLSLLDSKDTQGSLLHTDPQLPHQGLGHRDRTRVGLQWPGIHTLQGDSALKTEVPHLVRCGESHRQTHFSEDAKNVTWLCFLPFYKNMACPRQRSRPVHLRRTEMQNFPKSRDSGGARRGIRREHTTDRVRLVAWRLVSH